MSWISGLLLLCVYESSNDKFIHCYRFSSIRLGTNLIMLKGDVVLTKYGTRGLLLKMLNSNSHITLES